MTADRTSYTVPGLTGPAEILVDRWGVPHIYAASTLRRVPRPGVQRGPRPLWQIDFWRRRGLGRLSEVFGAEHVERDRAARLFLYRGDMRREWLSYGSDTKRATTAFVDGVNAFRTDFDARAL
jgi:penicillin amidase